MSDIIRVIAYLLFITFTMKLDRDVMTTKDTIILIILTFMFSLTLNTLF